MFLSVLDRWEGKKPMRLYFIRHGIAEVGNGIEDFERKLTKAGVEQMRTGAQVMAKLKVKPAHIYTSPRVRARQTADIVAQALGVQVEVHPDVDYEFNLQVVETLTAGLDDAAEVMFVGHEPSFSETVGELTGGNVIMKKGGLARIDVSSREPLRGSLVWLIAPRVFEMLG
jgi:phosphohistidine phosphatase